MDKHICESFARSQTRIVCDLCNKSIVYFDRLDDGSRCCLACSYKEGFTPSDECVFHAKEFDPTDIDVLSEMLSICQIDIENSSKETNSISIVIPDDLTGPLKKITALHASTINAEIVAALGWYTTLCLQRTREFSDVSFIPSDTTISSDLPEELQRSSINSGEA